MLKITITTAKNVPTTVCRLVLSEDPPSTHRFVETADGGLEYRLGAGKWADMTVRTFRTLIRSIVQIAKSHQIEAIAIDLPQSNWPKLSTYSSSWYYSTIAENLLLASYEYTRYKTKKKTNKTSLREVFVCSEPGDKEAQQGISRGTTIATATNHARDLANTPGNDLSPSDLAKAVTTLSKGTGIKTTILGESALKKLKMGALLAVGQGTKSETKLIIAEYWGAGKPSKKGDKSKRPVVLIGKGITFDSGGLNVKPSGAMHDMHMDMAGGAAVFGTILAVANLKLKKNVIALIPAAENAISDDSMRAGDILTTMSGQTVEVLHTDAEGRLVLADALTYAARYEPQSIIDVATLTGASLVALGTYASALMTKDGTLQNTLMKLGEDSGDLVWPLPLWDEYKQHLKSTRADLANIDPTFARNHGCIEGGVFLSHFAPKDVPWAHLDIAPRMESVSADKLAKGATGEPVRLLTTFIEQA